MTTRLIQRRVLLVLVLAVVACGAPASAEPTRSGLLVDLAGLRTLDGRTVDTTSLAGRAVLVDFWATWCAPCLAELPTLRRAWDLYGDRGLEILAVSLDRAPRRELLGFAGRHSIEWTVAHDGRGFQGALAQRWNVEAVPRSFLFDRQGRLVAADLRGDALLAVLGVLLGAPDKARHEATPLPRTLE